MTADTPSPALMTDLDALELICEALWYSQPTSTHRDARQRHASARDAIDKLIKDHKTV